MSGEVTQLSEWRREQRGTQVSYEIDPHTFEIATQGLDETIQGVGGDPFGGSSWVGLRVPTAPTDTLAQPAADSRYLLLLATFSISESVKARILGFRQMVRLGYLQPASTDDQNSKPRPITQEVTDPAWRFVDGNVSFHLQAMGPPNAQGIVYDLQNANDAVCVKYEMSQTPALLYKTITYPQPFYVDLTAYNPPNRGRPPGRALRSGGQSMIYGLRTQWHTHGGWSSLGFDVEGPETVGLFASVRQTNPSTRPALTPPGTFYSGGLSAEEQFLLNFPSAVYWSVAGSLIVRMGG